MKAKTKLLYLFVMIAMAMVMVVVGVFAVKTTSFDIGGTISFNAKGIEAVISAGSLNYDEAYVTSSDKGSVMQSVRFSTDSSKDTSNKVSTWSKLNLQFNESGDDIVLSFSITNVSTRSNDYLSIQITPPADSDNITIVVSEEASCLSSSADSTTESTKNYTITFSVIDDTVNAKLENFAIKFDLEQVKDISAYPLLTFTETTAKASSLSVKSSTNTIKEVSVKYVNAYEDASELVDDDYNINFNEGIGAEVIIPAYIKKDGQVYAITSIDDYGFACCGDLESILLPNTLKTIGTSSFSYCESKYMVDEDYWNNLEEIYGDDYDKIYEVILQEKGGLRNIIIPNSVEIICDNAFFYCYELQSIVIGNGVETIGSESLNTCGMETLTLGSSVKSIGDYAFGDCDKLTSITIPASLTSIGYDAFYYCYALSSVNYLGTLAQWCSINFESSNPVAKSESLTIQGETLSGAITIPSGVTSIGNGVFSGLSEMTSVTIPSSVTSIGSYAFSNCTGLTSITIPSSVTSIGSYAFWYSSNLTSVIFNTTSGWKADSTSLTSSDLSNTSTAATYLTSTYNRYTWTRS